MYVIKDFIFSLFTIFSRCSDTALWDLSFLTSEIRKKSIAIEARLSLCTALSAVVAALPEDQSLLLLRDIASTPLDRLDRVVKLGSQAFDGPNLQSTQSSAGHEIRILGELIKRFTNPLSVGAQRQEVTSPIVMPVIDIVGKGWHNIAFVAGNWSTEKVSIKHFHRFAHIHVTQSLRKRILHLLCSHFFQICYQ